MLAVNSLQTAIRLLANIALINPLGYNGLALSAALGLSVQLGVLAWLVRRRLGAYLTRDWWRSARHGILATIPARRVHRDRHESGGVESREGVRSGESPARGIAGV